MNIIYENNGMKCDKKRIVIIFFVSYFDTNIIDNE